MGRQAGRGPTSRRGAGKPTVGRQAGHGPASRPWARKPARGWQADCGPASRQWAGKPATGRQAGHGPASRPGAGKPTAGRQAGHGLASWRCTSFVSIGDFNRRWQLARDCEQQQCMCNHAKSTALVLGWRPQRGTCRQRHGDRLCPPCLCCHALRTNRIRHRIVGILVPSVRPHNTV